MMIYLAQHWPSFQTSPVSKWKALYLQFSSWKKNHAGHSSPQNYSLLWIIWKLYGPLYAKATMPVPQDKLSYIYSVLTLDCWFLWGKLGSVVPVTTQLPFSWDCRMTCQVTVQT